MRKKGGGGRGRYLLSVDVDDSELVAEVVEHLCVQTLHVGDDQLDAFTERGFTKNTFDIYIISIYVYFNC